jgi:hypothetical protein
MFIVPSDTRGGLVGILVVAMVSAAVFVGLAQVFTRRTMRA